MLSQVFTGGGKPFPYYPKLCADFDISVTSCILLCYIGWKAYNCEEWVYLASTDITSETGLGAKQQITGRAQLKAKGLIEEQYRRLEHRMFYRLKGVEMPTNCPKRQNGDSPSQGTRSEGVVPQTPERQLPNRQNGDSSIECRTVHKTPYSPPDAAKVLFHAFQAAFQHYTPCGEKNITAELKAAAELLRSGETQESLLHLARLNSAVDFPGHRGQSATLMLLQKNLCAIKARLTGKPNATSQRHNRASVDRNAGTCNQGRASQYDLSTLPPEV